MSTTTTPLISLVTVRAELTIDTDSSPSASPIKLKAEDININTNSSDNKAASATEADCSEPFPEYEETQKEDESFDVAYKLAFNAAVQATIRVRTVESRIMATVLHPGKKEQALDAMKAGLAHPGLHPSSRERFVALTNMILRLDATLFSGTIGDLLNPQAAATALRITNKILTFAKWVDGMMRDLSGAAGNVFHMLEYIRDDDNATELERHVNMSRLVSAQLKKPRLAEEKTLCLFLDLYDEWIHNQFLQLRNIQMTPKEVLDVARLDLTRNIHAIWDTLTRAIKNYTVYRDMLDKIKEKYFKELVERIPTTYGAVARCFGEDTYETYG